MLNKLTIERCEEKCLNKLSMSVVQDGVVTPLVSVEPGLTMPAAAKVLTVAILCGSITGTRMPNGLVLYRAYLQPACNQ